MLAEQTIRKLNEMKMYGLAGAFEQYLEERGTDKLSYEERFSMMVDREYAERQERKLRRRLSIAKMREQACIEDVDYRHPRKLDRTVMQRLATCKWIETSENVIITGATGIGKTWLACALANKACREGHSAIYARVPRLLHTLHIARADGTYIRELTRLQKARVLVLDDLGLAPLTEQERHDMLEVIEDRHGRGSTIVASQLPVSKWHDTVGDPTIADAILDRIVNRAHRLELKGGTMRKPRGKKK
jgi:DNA replication protein DnaC